MPFTSYPLMSRSIEKAAANAIAGYPKRATAHNKLPCRFHDPRQNGLNLTCSRPEQMIDGNRDVICLISLRPSLRQLLVLCVLRIFALLHLQESMFLRLLRPFKRGVHTGREFKRCQVGSRTLREFVAFCLRLVVGEAIFCFLAALNFTYCARAQKGNSTRQSFPDSTIEGDHQLSRSEPSRGGEKKAELAPASVPSRSFVIMRLDPAERNLAYCV